MASGMEKLEAMRSKTPLHGSLLVRFPASFSAPLLWRPVSEDRGCLEEGCLGLAGVFPDIF